MLKNSYKTFLQFCIVGVANTLIDFGIFIILLKSTGWVILANIIGFLAGMTNSYLMNKYWTFADRTPHSSVQIIRFVAIAGAGLVLSTLIIFFGKAIIPVVWAKVFSIGVVLVWNYAGNRIFVFSQGETRR